MGLSQFLGCLCGGLNSRGEYLSPRNSDYSCKVDPEQSGPQDVDATEEVLRLQKEISAFSGLSLKSRLTRVLATVSEYTTTDASLFAVIDEGQFILLATSRTNGVHNVLGREPGHMQTSVLQSMFASQRPAIGEYQTSDTGSVSTGEGLCAVYATPLFGGSFVAGALVLEANYAGSEKSLLNSTMTWSLDQRCAQRARQRLFSTPTLLQQLGLAVSVGLGMDGEQLQWLARTLQRIAHCDDMNSLVGELCEGFSAHVKRRFILEASVRAALMPRADAPLGLLFQPHLFSNNPRGKLLEPSGGLSKSARSSMEYNNSAPTNVVQLPSGIGKLDGLVSRNRLNALATGSAAGSDCGTATSRGPKPQASTQAGFFTEQVSTSGRALKLHIDAVGGSHLAKPHPAATSALPLSTSRTIVVQLPPHMAAEAPSASLHAQAFPLKHTVLQMLACGNGDGASSSSQQSFPGTCIEDVALYLQNVHSPSRDVCLLLGALRTAGQPGSPRTAHAAPQTAPSSTLHTVSGGVIGPSSWGSAATAPLQSLVLVGLRLGESVLCFYVCFSKRLPCELLVAIRDSCNELLGEVFVDVVRVKLEDSLAAEFGALRSTTPGHFAVLRSASVNGLQQRSGSQSNVSARAARVIGQPRTNCGSVTQVKTISGCSESAAATPTGAAAAVEGAPCATSCKLLQRPSMELCCSSPGDNTREADTARPMTSSARGAGTSQLVSFTLDRGGGAAVGSVGGGKPNGASSRCIVRQPSQEILQHVPLTNDDLMSVLMQMRQSETVCSQGDALSASIMTVTGVDEATTARQQLDLLVTSIQTTMTTEFHGATVTFPEDLESLELLDVLGKGGGGVVYKGRLGTQEVAVKVMELPDLDAGEPQAAPEGALMTQACNRASAAATAREQLRARRALLRNAMEMAVQGRVSHPNLIQVYATYTSVMIERRTTADGSSYNCLVPADMGVHDFGLPSAPMVCCCAIVSELADFGSLAAALNSRVFPRLAVAEHHPFQLDLRGVYMTLLDVALALRHLHSLNLVHRDIKPANLLLKSNPRDYRGFTVKLADFGFVMHLTETADDGTRYALVDQACGTVTHMAPELLPGKARVDASADIYSFGILMWELLSGGVRPFPHLNPDAIPRHVFKGARPTFGDLVPLTYRGIAQACWSSDPHRRPKATDLVALITSQMLELD